MFLANIASPGIGLIVWQTVTFLIVLGLLAKFAFPMITKSIKEREESIADALSAAEKAKEEMAALQASNEELLKEAREERSKILKEAKDAKDAIVAEAKDKANKEAEKILANARETINNEKMAAITELKNQVATLSIDIAEKIIKQELSDEKKQQVLTDNLLEEVSLN